jgi:AraC family transcriptional regulator
LRVILASTLLIVLSLIGTLAMRLGAFKEVALHESEMGPYKLVFKPHLGAYHKIVPVIEEVETWTKKAGEPCRLSFGEYIDNPDTVSEDRLRSNGGCIVNKDIKELLGGVHARFPAEFAFRETDRHMYLVAEFDGAPSIGPIKVYPKAKTYMANHGLELDGSIFEIYEILADRKVKTTYLFPIRK